MRITRTVIAIAISLSIGVGIASASGGNPGIVPINANAHGQSYSQLAAAWWKWAFETPTPDNAVIDTTGANCGKNQTDHLWFLAGSLSGGTVNRTCQVPTGTFLFFPLANDFYGAFLTDPDNERTEAFVRSQTTCVIGSDLHAEIDGAPVNAPSQYLEESPLFTIHFPTDNIFGFTTNDIPALTLDPSVDTGYYLYLNPLPPGPHTIHFTTGPGTGCGPTQDITYNLTVGK
jgi:hypothetical protein